MTARKKSMLRETIDRSFDFGGEKVARWILHKFNGKDESRDSSTKDVGVRPKKSGDH